MLLKTNEKCAALYSPMSRWKWVQFATIRS